MKVVLEINNQTSCNFNRKRLKLAIGETILNSGLQSLFSKTVTVSLGVVNPKKIREINKKYRGKDYATDILSFANYASQTEITIEKKKEIFLGDLIICIEDIIEYTKKENIPLAEELLRVVSHGTLHLLSFIHGDKMFKIQEGIVINNKKNIKLPV